MKNQRCNFTFPSEITSLEQCVLLNGKLASVFKAKEIGTSVIQEIGRVGLVSF